ncbi:hypothetical protein [Roseitranquillus sediminis]|uniref:hypothetical protein n=1 Tax=Roseitranquillus sediminis TaxID=2809051 RepID=UPI001D0C07B3|nr:hypothetical protein [Roseitranquillus sediminis]MBM9594470.1 hypothetical protein [Roseitranquillus sediminis]
MATHIISFRIENNSGYAERWASTVAAIRREADGSAWDETTSFFLIRSAKTADALATSIYVGSKFNSTCDTLLVVNAANATYATRGVIKYPATLASFFQRNALDGLLAG